MKDYTEMIYKHTYHRQFFSSQQINLLHTQMVIDIFLSIDTTTVLETVRADSSNLPTIRPIPAPFTRTSASIIVLLFTNSEGAGCSWKLIHAIELG